MELDTNKIYNIEKSKCYSKRDEKIMDLFDILD